MSDPPRLLEAGNDLEAALLRSAEDDGPSPHARRRTMLALGIGGGIVSATATVTTATAAASTTAAVTTTTTAGILKWIVFGIMTGVATAGGGELIRQAHEAPAKPAVAVRGPSVLVERMRLDGALPSATKPMAAPAPAASVLASPSASTAASPAVAPPPAPQALQAPAAPSAPRPPASGPTTLAQEVASLDGAREALSSGDASKALAALDSHEKQFKGGALGPEVEVLRMEALLQRGDRAGAAAAANVFLAAHPTSPHANRVRSILGQATSGASTRASSPP